MSHISKFDEWNSANESELNEIFGLGKLVKNFIQKQATNLSNPIKNKVKEISKAIGDKASELSTENLKKNINSALDEISKELEDEMNKAKNEEDVKSAMKNFITNIKVIFVSSNIPLEGMVKDPDRWGDLPESLSVDESFLNERFDSFLGDMTKDFIATLISKPEEFDKKLDEFVEDFYNSKTSIFGEPGANLQDGKTKFIKFSEGLISNFKKKLDGLGEDKLKQIVVGKGKNPTGDYYEWFRNFRKTVTSEGAEEVKTEDGKKQILDSVSKAVKDGSTMMKIKKGEKAMIIISDVEI